MLAGVGRIGWCGLRRPLTITSSRLYAIREVTTRVEPVKDSNHEINSQKNVFFSNSREGDWVCPDCGVLSFSWRNVCFKCGASKPSLTKKSPSAVDGKSPRRGQNQSPKGKEEITLKDLLLQGQKARDYDLVLKESEKILKQRKLIKSSVVATIIRAFGKSGNVNRAVELFNDIGRHPFIVRRPTPYHYAATITACSDNGKWETALDVFDHMRVNSSRTKSIVVCSSAMSACNKAKQYNHVIRIFNTIMTEGGWVLDTVSYNIVLDSFVKIGNYSRAYELYEQMNSSKIKKDLRTYGVMLDCCGRSGDWVLAQELLKQINLSRNIEINSVMYTSALMAYARGGEPEKGLELFEKLKSQTKLLMDYPLYSALLFTLSQLPTGRQSGIQSLEVLNEMTKRHIKLSVKIVTTVIGCLDKDEMHDSAVILYDMARANGMFAHCDPQIVFPGQDSVSQTTGSVASGEVDGDRRIDFRHNSAPMIRVMLRSIFLRVKEADRAPVDDYLIILGKRRELWGRSFFVVSSLTGNSNKELASLVENIFETNIAPGNPIRIQRVEGDRILRLPSHSLTKWLRLLKTSPMASPTETDLPSYKFKVHPSDHKRVLDDDSSYLIDDTEEGEESLSETLYDDLDHTHEIIETAADEAPEPSHHRKVRYEKTSRGRSSPRQETSSRGR
jgi:pentatricopeptide repeat protein